MVRGYPAYHGKDFVDFRFPKHVVYQFPISWPSQRDQVKYLLYKINYLIHVYLASN